MKQGIVGFCLLFLLVYLGCSNAPEHRVSGQWQLKSRQFEGNETVVDTVFFSFQRGKLFSLTLLLNAEEALPYYGYLSMPTEDSFYIEMDTSKDPSGSWLTNMPDTARLRPYGWHKDNGYTQLLYIDRLESRTMQLRTEEGVIYLFKKF